MQHAKGHRYGSQSRLMCSIEADIRAAAPDRVLLAALVAVEEGQRPWLVFWVHSGRRGDGRKGFTEAGYARLLDAAHQQFGDPIVLVWNILNTHVSKAMRELIVARDWLTVYQLPPYASELDLVE